MSDAALIECEGQAVDLAVVGIELIKLYGLAFVAVNHIENRDDVVLGEGVVQPTDHVLEALEGQIAIAFAIVGLEGLFQRYFLVVQHPV